MWMRRQSTNEQIYQSTVIWLRIINRQAAYIQTIAVTEGRKVLPRTNCGQNLDKVPTKFGKSQIQPTFQDLAPGWKKPSPDNKVFYTLPGREDETNRL